MNRKNSKNNKTKAEEKETISRRKSEHIEICLRKDVSFSISSGFDKYAFIHNALPETSLDEITTKTNFIGKALDMPFLISSMSGGTKIAEKINKNLATAAERLNVAFAVGSQRAAIRNKELRKSFDIRKYAEDALILANLGAVQLNYGFGIKEYQDAVDMIDADALIIHLNPLQEAIQPEGDIDFSNLAEKIEHLCKNITVPVIAKEVGNGISYDAAKMLKKAGVKAIDIAGSGGTSWAAVEGHRTKDKTKKKIAETFRNWGIPTTASIRMAKKADIDIIASGGIRNGIDIAKSIVLGAKIAGIALPLLKPALVSSKAVEEKIRQYKEELRIAMFATGSKNIAMLKKARLVKIS